MRVAVVGAGISGLTAAYYLSRAHEVDLYERNDYAGGHTRTVCFDDGKNVLGLDMGFMVYNEASYPGFSALLRELGIETQPSDMSFGVSCAACKVEYSSRGVPGMLAHRSSAVRPSMLRLGFDIVRFYRDAVRCLSNRAFEDVTVTRYLSEKRYSDGFRRHFIYPLLAAVWSTPPSMVDVFPLQYFLRFIHNHGLIGPGAFRWRTVKGGSARYVDRMLSTSRVTTRISAPARSVRRGPYTVSVTTEDCRTAAYDKVVLACHADEALDLLSDAGHKEIEALSAFTYTKNSVVLHSDKAMLPTSRAARASWNYVTPDCRAPSAPLTLTYHLNRLQALDTDQHFCVSLNAKDIEPQSVIHQSEFSHPRYTFRTLEGQRLIGEIQGERHTFFAGAYLGYGFHEDGYVAGRDVAAMLGVGP
jgi:predicted NAD/FAD-binding protein